MEGYEKKADGKLMSWRQLWELGTEVGGKRVSFRIARDKKALFVVT